MRARVRIVRGRDAAAAARGPPPGVERRRARDPRRGPRAAATRAVLRLTERFDRAELGPEQLRVDPRELEASVGVLEPEVLAGLRTAIANVRAVAQAQLREPVAVELPQGQRVEVAEVPVRRAAVYVPGGRAPYPSTVVMCAVTARAAGVERDRGLRAAGPGRPRAPGDPGRLRRCAG